MIGVSTIKNSHWREHAAMSFLIAVLSVGAATLLRWLLDPILGNHHGLLLYYGSLAIAAWHGGWWPAMFALVSGYLIADWFFMSPRGELSLFTLLPVHLTGAGTYAAAGIIIAAFSESAKRAQVQAEINAELARERSRRLEREIAQRKQADEEIRLLNSGLEQRVKERTAELLAANQELEAFSYSVSHDLRAPLRSINAFTKLLSEHGAGMFGEEDKHLLELVIQSSRRMDDLITDLLSLSQVSRAEMLREPINLSELVRRISARIRAGEAQRSAEFIIAPNLTTCGDGRLLRIALENLLNNAWKFTRHCPERRIEFGVEEQDGGSVYFVRDNGAGFDMANAGKLFTPFQRLHSETEFPGTGVGLAIVQRIINRHGGRIWAEGAVDAGATFYFTLTDQTKPLGLAKDDSRMANVKELKLDFAPSSERALQKV